MVSAGLGLYLATLFVVGVRVATYPDSSFVGISISQDWKFFVLFGIILGLLNYFVRPVLNAITLPLRLVTLGLFGFVINMALVWWMDYSFRELSIQWLYPLLLVTLIIGVLNLVIGNVLARSQD